MVARRLLLTAALACLSAASAQYDAEPPELDGEGRLKPGCAPAIDPGAFAGVAHVLSGGCASAIVQLQLHTSVQLCTQPCNCAMPDREQVCHSRRQLQWHAGGTLRP